MTVSLPKEKKDKLVCLCSQLLNMSNPTVQFVAMIIGKMVSSFPAVEYGPLYCHYIQKDKNVGLNANCGNFDGKMHLSVNSKSELQWWIKHVPTAFRVISHGNPHKCLYTDASQTGWGAVIQGLSTQGYWSASESNLHINVLELKAVFCGLKSLCRNFKDLHLQVQSDNFTAVTYINNMGGSKSLTCHEVTVEIWEFCIQRNIYLSANYIPGSQNTNADKLSREVVDRHDWMLKPDIFHIIQEKYPSIEIDLFASRHTNQVPLYVSWHPDPSAFATDAFSFNWSNIVFFAFPPFSLIGRCLQKIRSDNAKGILVAPFWPTQPWFPQLLQMLWDHPVVLPSQKDLLTHPSYPHKLHPLREKLKLIVCPLSGRQSESLEFQKTLPPSLSQHGETPPKSSIQHISNSGWSFQIKDKLIFLHQI